MGCDIHCYIDYDDFVTREGEMVVGNFSDRIGFGRNYELFSLMAGVRYDPHRMDGKEPLFQPKGLPKKVSWIVSGQYYLWVTDQYQDGDGNCSKASAESWVRSGISEWVDENHVTHPDWHSASWLTAEELEKVQEAYTQIETPPMSWYQSPAQALPENGRVTGNDGGMILVEVGERTKNKPYLALSAIIAAMKALDGDTPGKSRLVFWFDN